MNLQQLRNVVEVARTGSITAAAKNLYMGQPNLSKSIKELETEIGIRLFRRTSHGVAPTQDGEDFLGYARSIISQMEKLETMFSPRIEQGTQLTVSSSRASYVAQAFSRYVGAEGRTPLRVQYRESNADTVIRDVATGLSNLGVVRWQAERAATLDALLRESRLSGETLWEFDMVLIMHETHPLAGLAEIPVHMLNDYPEIVYGDLAPLEPVQQPVRSVGRPHGRISVFNRDIQFDVLQYVPGSFMWAGPMSYALLAQHHLVQKPCSAAVRCRDVMIRRRPGALSAVEVGFVNAMRREIVKLSKE